MHRSQPRILARLNPRSLAGYFRWCCARTSASLQQVHSYEAQTPACHRTHLRTARRVWRTVVRATHTPLILVLPRPHPTAICVTMSSGGASGAGVMPCAEVAIVKAKPATAINLSIVFLPWLEQSARGGFWPPRSDLRCLLADVHHARGRV